jgi:hypothetical protein
MRWLLSKAAANTAFQKKKEKKRKHPHQHGRPKRPKGNGINSGAQRNGLCRSLLAFWCIAALLFLRPFFPFSFD